MSVPARPTLAILHTTPVTVTSMKELAARELPDVRVINILDDSLLADVIAAGGVTDAVRQRLDGYAHQAATAGAGALMTACSSIGGAIEELRSASPIPLWRVDEPMAEEAVKRGKHVGVIATVATTLEPTAALVRRKAQELGREVEVEAVLVRGAYDALLAGRGEEHDRLVTQALRALIERSNVVVLAQASMARLLDALGDTSGVAVLSSPKSGLAAAGQKVKEL
jgi:glutamate racemase